MKKKPNHNTEEKYKTTPVEKNERRQEIKGKEKRNIQ